MDEVGTKSVTMLCEGLVDLCWNAPIGRLISSKFIVNKLFFLFLVTVLTLGDQFLSSQIPSVYILEIASRVF